MASEGVHEGAVPLRTDGGPFGFPMGPVLIFRGLEDGRVYLAALSVTEPDQRPGELDAKGDGPVMPEPLLSWDGYTLWRHRFTLSGPPGSWAGYSFAGHEHRVALPPEDGPRILFTACNGSEEPDALPDDSRERNRTWTMIRDVHQRQPFHLLLQGGDQVYADQVWLAHPDLALMKEQRARAANHPFNAAMAEGVARFYFDLHVKTFGQPEIAPLLASVPSLMMWDDHDIIDGWGSWRPELQQSDVYRGIYRSARSAFAGFQLGVAPDEPLPAGFLDQTGVHYSWLYRVGPVAVWAPDLRSERSQSQVLGESGWRDLDKALEHACGCEQLLVVSTVPILNSPLRMLERIHFAIPGHQYLQDDLRDQWQSYEHAGEWQRLVDRLLRFKTETGARITVLSGEIHLGAYGLLRAEAGNIQQLISSGVVHPPLPQVVANVMRGFGRFRQSIGRRASFRMLPVPGFGVRYLNERNWLSLTRSGNGYVAQWHAEGSGNGEELELI